MCEYSGIYIPQFCGYTLSDRYPLGVRRVISYEPLFLTMKKKGITTYKLFKMGFSKSTYYAMKDGKSVLVSTIDQLCTLLECEVSDVVKFVPEQD